MEFDAGSESFKPASSKSDEVADGARGRGFGHVAVPWTLQRPARSRLPADGRAHESRTFC
jgi:hypothetical protein